MLLHMCNYKKKKSWLPEVENHTLPDLSSLAHPHRVYFIVIVNFIILQFMYFSNGLWSSQLKVSISFTSAN